VQLTVLSSGSGGNSALIRAGATDLLVDAGLGAAEMEQRLEGARLGLCGLRHVLVTHGHLDHARSAGRMARVHGATLHCAQSLLANASLRRARRTAVLPIGPRFELEAATNEEAVEVTAVALPHDASPTVAFRLEHAGRKTVILTDMGRVDHDVARALRGPHVLVLEFNHDERLLEEGPYPALLKRRIAGNGGHLSNKQAARMLVELIGEDTHTLVLAHLSETNNRPELALEAARGALELAGVASQVRVLVARQDRALEAIAV
jgi:phosphoribosyl 1,2-cyclic phosphodiesterase